MKGVEKKAPPGWLAVPNKSMTYIDLAKLFNVDAVTYNIFIREFYPFGSGEPLVVRTHKALRPTNIKQGTHVPDPNHELWKKYFAKLTKQTLAVKPIITQSNTRENKLNLVAWDNPVPLDVWYHANRKDLYKRGRLFYVLQIQLDKVVKIGVASPNFFRPPGARLRDYMHAYGYVDAKDKRMGVRVLYILWTPYNPNTQPVKSKIHKVELHLIRRIKQSGAKPDGRGRERIKNTVPLTQVRKWVEEVVTVAKDEPESPKCRTRKEKATAMCQQKQVKETPL